EREEEVTVDAVHRIDGTENRQRQRMTTPEIEREQVVDEVVGRVFRLRDFLEDHLTLAVDFFGSKDRLQEDVREQFGGHREVLPQHLRVIASVLLTGKRVQYAADRVHLLGDLRGGPLAGALEQQVLDKVADSVVAGVFVA